MSKAGNISLGDDGIREISRTSKVPVKRLISEKWHKINLENVLYVPSFKNNLFSIGECTDKKYEIVFSVDLVGIYLNDQLIVQGLKQGNKTYPLFLQAIGNEAANVTTSHNFKMSHFRSGHLNKKCLKEMKDKGLVLGIHFTDSEDLF